MGKLIGLAIAAGLASALLFGVVATGAPAGMLLCYLAPLPIVIVALGWHHLLGLLAAAVGALVLSFAIRSSAGLVFFLGAALPAWGLAYLASFRWRGAEKSGDRSAGAAAGFLPPGHLLFAVGLAGALMAFVSALALGQGDHERFEDTLRQVAEGLLRAELRIPRGEPLGTVAGVSAGTFVSVLIAIAPAVAAAAFGLALALNLWIGARVVAFSGRLSRDLPRVPETRMPTAALWTLLAGVILIFGSGYLDVLGRALAGSFGLIFAIQGLAFLHFATAGRPVRAGILSVAYLLTFFMGGTFVPLLALVGMADTAFPLRQRFGSGRGGPPQGRPTPPPTFRT